MSRAGIVLSAFIGSSGKTAVTSTLLAGLSERGIAHQPFKAGPDYIDPGFHRHYSTEAPYNLDLFMMPESDILRLARSADGFGLLEGMDGLFEGIRPNSDEGSTVQLARMLDWPVILVIDASRANRSSYAAVKGFIAEAKPAIVAGVIFNKIRSDSHEHYLRTAYESEGIAVLGAIRTHKALDWPERHLGLRPGLEFQLPSRQALATIAEAELDIDALLRLVPNSDCTAARHPKTKTRTKRRIAIAMDEAFHFYYRDSLELLAELGLELIPFSPLHDSRLPAKVHGLILGGGFPEMYAEPLSSNRTLLGDIAKRHHDGMPIYAECGGFMFLAENIQSNEKRYPMCSIIPGNVVFTKQLQNFGYSHVHHPSGTFRGHEFHYSYWDRETELANLWEVNKAASGSRRMEGYQSKHLHASYIHLNFREAASIFRNLFVC
ncbi:cobyrinic acid a,c-diamide synthase [Coraliomargarita akajimensis DSM 45221]|uniref:Cobyrinic acid a,c-diamide synthase n=2 Tax=Coraliomargarita TaxID=442430 RepID=D5ENG8_CORAD|nr:cobyrinic acid a,c-diamide synthase [Coraliomargarita akajimensis DSM 45221]